MNIPLLNKLKEGYYLSLEELETLQSDLNCRIIEQDLPGTYKGLTVQESNTGYVICINSALNDQSKLEVLAHELSHIAEDDFANEKTLQEKESK